MVNYLRVVSLENYKITKIDYILQNQNIMRQGILSKSHGDIVFTDINRPD